MVWRRKECVWERGKQEEWRRRRRRKRETERAEGWKAGWRWTEGKRDRVLRELTCGNPVFMDVYLSAGPTGSSYFPFGNSWWLEKMSLTGSGTAGRQISDGVTPQWDKVTKTYFSISICLCAVLLHINQSIFRVWMHIISIWMHHSLSFI